MKAIIELKNALSDETYYNNMFEKWGEQKNILFVSPQLSGKHLYKSLIPFYCLVDKDYAIEIYQNGESKGFVSIRDSKIIVQERQYSIRFKTAKKAQNYIESRKLNEKKGIKAMVVGVDQIATAITSLKSYNYEKQLLDFQIDLSDAMIHWADFIVFPFTTQPLVDEVYKHIRDIKPEAKIVYQVDFNFYELSDKHPYKDIFSEEMVVNCVEDNMYFADIVLVNNAHFVEYIIDKFQKMIQDGRYKDVGGYMSVGALATMIDSEIILQNIDDFKAADPHVVKHEIQHSPAVTDLIEQTSVSHEKVTLDDLKQKKEITEDKVEKKEIKEKMVKVKRKLKSLKKYPKNDTAAKRTTAKSAAKRGKSKELAAAESTTTTATKSRGKGRGAAKKGKRK